MLQMNAALRRPYWRWAFRMICTGAIAILSLAAAVAAAQPIDTPPSLKTSLDRVAYAVVTPDDLAALELSDPTLIADIGGEAEAIKMFEAARASTQRIGGKLLKMTFNEPTQLTFVGPHLHAVATYDGLMRIDYEQRHGYATFRSFYYAVSRDSGKTWGFMDGQTLSLEYLKHAYPLYDGVPALPAKEKPIFYPDE